MLENGQKVTINGFWGSEFWSQPSPTILALKVVGGDYNSAVHIAAPLLVPMPHGHDEAYS